MRFTTATNLCRIILVAVLACNAVAWSWDAVVRATPATAAEPHSVPMLPPNETVFLSAYKDMVQTRKAYEVTMDIMRKDVEGGFPYDGHKVTTALESFNFLERKMECAERDWMEVVEALEKQWAEEVDYNEWVTAETKTALALLK